MSSVQKHREHAAKTPQVNIQRSTFDRSMGTKTTFDAGYIVPLKVEEIIPGDTIDLKTNCFLRLLTPIVPYMDNLYVDFFAFFTPMRLVWNNAQKFFGERENPEDNPDIYSIPQVSGLNLARGTLMDYFGIPLTGPDTITVNALPFRAYNLIYNEWFRDQDLIDSIPVPKDNGPDDIGDYEVKRRMKRHDYFTAARPWPQKGPDVLIPMADNVPVIPGPGTGPTLSWGTPSPGNTGNLYLNSSTNVNWGGSNTPSSGQSLDWANPDLQVLTAEIGGTINQLRQAEAVQVLLERDARGGTRYIEMLKSQYGVTNPDYRLQRPELIAQGQLEIKVSPVPQTSSTDDTSPQGNLAAFALGSMKQGFNFTHSFTEHGYLHIMCSARADLNYQQGLQKMWSRQKRFDFYVPALAHLGEQAILNKELRWFGDDPANDEVFGYIGRWDEYRYGYNNITGAFRQDAPQNLSQWHLAQWFTGSTPPALNQEFIEENPPLDRVLAVEPQGDSFFGDFWFNIKHTRPMPVYSIPGWSRSL